ncbi:proenkephalin b isoform X1 [Erpetoichthys calabaricus]|uniref:Proenkephalin a n=1 Tax=Erpetoichthys calabaricus TaxID=27687 RepID=A0A8C4RVX9_ERPCA|nr:proenkephalin b isoform X1 [Erpetoichthys calabaricus]
MTKQPMAVMRRCLWWMLAVSACLILTVRAECGKDCAYCAYQLRDRRPELNTVTCTLECEGKVSTTKSWEACKDILQGNKPDILTDDGRASSESTTNESEEHQLAKKYGGFMKRYGGFMKKTAELYNVEPDEENEGTEIIAKRYGGFMKKDMENSPQVDTESILKELLMHGAESDMESNGDHDGEILKRYGGFMRSIKRSLDLEDGIKDLQKRYGGFMRRVGTPDWKENQKRYGGFFKRPKAETSESNSEELADVEKRYGGFMGY